MGNGNIVVLALGSLLSEIGGKGCIPNADELGGVEDGIAQVSGASLLHMGIAVCELPGLVGGWRKTSVGQHLILGIEP